MYGRPLRGTEASEPTAPIRGPGSISKTPYYHDSWAGGDASVEQANVDDDTIGNGIFDGPGSAPIQHAGSGVFEAKYSEPGWLYREKMNEVSEIVDANTGGQMVFRPGGGGWQNDMASSYNPFANETPRYYATGSVDTDEGKAGVGSWAVAGLIAGVAVALFVGTLKIKG